MISSTSNSILHQVAHEFLGTHSEETYQKLINNGFSKEQMLEIEFIVNEKDLREVIVNKVLQILKENVVCFIEIPDFAFANTYPCTIDFEGKSYASAAACYFDQNWTPPSSPYHSLGTQTRRLSWDGKADPKSMSSKVADKVEKSNSVDKYSQRRRKGKSEVPIMLKKQPVIEEHREPLSAARVVARPMNNRYKIAISKSELMLKILRAKFDQHQELKDLLLKTGRAYIVCQLNRDRFWSDGFIGNGQNQLGTCLMQLRLEYKGEVGIVPKPACYEIMVENLKERMQALETTPSSEIQRSLKRGKILSSLNDAMWLIFLHCYKNGDKSCVLGLPYISESIYKHIQLNIKLNELCPKLNVITLADLKLLEVVPHDFCYEGDIGTFGLLQGYLHLIARISGDEGITYINIPKGLSRKLAIEIAQRYNIKVHKDEKIIFDVHENDIVLETYSLLITDGVLKNTVTREYGKLYEDVVTRYRCEMPTPQELLFLCILIKIIFNKSIYPANTLGTTVREDGEEEPLVIGVTIEQAENNRERGDGNQEAVIITSYEPQWVLRDKKEMRVFERDDTGAGGCLRKYETYGPYPVNPKSLGLGGQKKGGRLQLKNSLTFTTGL